MAAEPVGGAGRSSPGAVAPLLSVTRLGIRYPDAPVAAVADVGFDLQAGQCVGLLGESGAGKSQVALALLGLLPNAAQVTGSVRVDGREMVEADETAWLAVRGRRIGLVFQEPATALAPHLTIGAQLVETLRRHSPLGRAAARRAAVEWLERVRLAEATTRLGQYPHELSGGQRQRVALALALAPRPALLVADEPTTALDVTVQRQVLDLLRELRAESRIALLLITHDAGVAAGLCDRLVVLRGGRVVETGAATEVYAAPTDPYTATLLGNVRGDGGDR